ncbi:MAG: alpha/beta hydrolase [Janthinobacterium lividum]
MFDYKVTTKRSFIATVSNKLMQISGIKSKLAKESFEKLQSYEDKKTPVKKGYLKEVIGNATVYWINKEKRENGIFVFLPGGGFVIGPTKLHWVYSEKMSNKLDMAVMVIRYALAPQNPFPAGLNGIVEVITKLQNRGVLNQNWFLGGESAGGNLALAACYKLQELKAALPQKVLLLYPSLEMNMDRAKPEAQKIIEKDMILSIPFTERILAAYARNCDLNDPLLSPLYGDVDIFPPILLQHGTDDILVAGSRALVQKMEAAGKQIKFEEYEGIFHGFILYPILPEARQAIRSQLKFLKS